MPTDRSGSAVPVRLIELRTYALGRMPTSAARQCATALGNEHLRVAVGLWRLYLTFRTLIDLVKKTGRLEGLAEPFPQELSQVVQGRRTSRPRRVHSMCSDPVSASWTLTNSPPPTYCSVKASYCLPLTLPAVPTVLRPEAEV